ncbi:2-succinyl-5-enolpyruvyl-6-hydroxy-3-cyclohexene-1-carboxylic-acid synthase [Nocardiopsis sp. N85]|uniref:2-succinyl-5-enolpyruvyl-6-hydroxy-3- cyclohexene-1-carboxylic-acid synthase n=1 Tax=Nocardiopsis sp. N85 TaxID=3029400 RepID=UPI00237EF20B|nr:2-succinyl-5-enolpyruvyl-6-hydroxy-3-cyclohexene-1-carboxylic-acid synthase [Nocardiopsis sp. N85]MDE3725288.1 2-succinyl-5-enolpyruvyl-6-hydroxy-3-cyclohexene-1-carboxylic-acid synthase [Nocardiopsis sp. N85]
MNPSTALARVLVDELARCGLAEAVVAPGSRSTPLALALVSHPGIRVHVRVDERSASFLALGLARTSRRPVAVVCTSGTAAANFHPAVLEADESGVPLLLLTADRPPELRATGANQTVDQIGLYGGAVRMFAEVGTPDPVPGMVAYWRSLIGRAWGAARGGRPGPVHLNVAFRDPLTPDGLGGEWIEPLEGRVDGAPWISRPGPVAEPVPFVLPDVERGVIVCGDGDYDPVPFLALAELTGWPLLAEPTSNARRVGAVSTYRHLLASPSIVSGPVPDLVVSAGRPNLSRQTLAFLRRARRHVVVTAGVLGDARAALADGFADPARTATDVVAAVEAPADLSFDEPRRTDWSRWWWRAESAARAALDAVLDEEETLTEPRLARDLSSHLPAGSLLFAGSSMPVRDLDSTMRARCGVRLVGNRGVSGIDGTVSTAIGAALAHQAADRSAGAFALLGDLAVLHDQNGLIIGPGEPRPDLAIVVVNNDGGGIFSGLEQAGHPDFERVFGTPHGVSMERVAAMADVPYIHLEWATDLPKALLGEGVRVVEVRTDRAEAAVLRRRLQESVDTALAEAL